MFSIVRYCKRFKFALGGIVYALRHDFSYRWQVVLIAVAVVIFAYWFWPLSETEVLFLGLAYFLILITELQNSAFEAAIDRMHPEIHDDIAHSKDMAAGAVLTAGFFLVFVMLVIGFEKLF